MLLELKIDEEGEDRRPTLQNSERSRSFLYAVWMKGRDKTFFVLTCTSLVYCDGMLKSAPQKHATNIAMLHLLKISTQHINTRAVSL